jgi:hypothetical protein
MKGMHVARRSRRLWRIAATLSVAGAFLVCGGGAAYAYLSVSGSSSGTGHPEAIKPLTVKASTGAGDLMPGTTGAVYFVVTNPNAFDVTLSTLRRIKSIKSTTTTSCAGANLKRAVTSTYPVSITLPATGTVTTSLAAVVTLTSIAPTQCQGRTFTVTLVFSGRAK